MNSDTVTLARSDVESVLSALTATYASFGQYTDGKVPELINSLNESLGRPPLFHKDKESGWYMIYDG